MGSTDKSSKSSKSNRDHSREGSSPSRRTPTNDAIGRSNSKNSHESFGREKTSSPEDQQRSASSHSTSARSRTPGNNNNKRCSSNQSASSTRAVTPQGRKTTTPEGAVYIGEASPNDGISTSSSTRGPRHGSPTIRPNSYSPAGVLAMADPSIKDLPLGTFKLGLPPSTSSAYHLAYGGSQLPIDVMSAGSSLLSPHQHALKSGLIGSPTSPYLAYSNRLKSSSGNGTDASSIGLCRDPYCTGCQLNSHLLAAAAAAAIAATTGTSVPQQASIQANGKLSTSPVPAPSTVSSSSSSSCPSGCVQCDHKSGSGSPYGSGMSTAAAASVAAAAYAHAQLSALAAASQLPYVCNWMAGDTVYCGKRFGTSEELLQHLRSHTNASVSNSVNTTDPSNAAAAAVATATALSMLSPTLPPPPPHSLALPSTHPFFSRTYPTPPLSPLATARYHPYGKPAPPMIPHSLSSLAFPLPPTHPAHVLPPPSHPHPHYFSPYSIYAAPRLGAASGLHQ